MSPGANQIPGPYGNPARLGRLSRSGLTGSACYLVISGLWLTLVRPPGPPAGYAAWVVLLAVLGAMVPGIANQVTLGRAYLAAAGLAYGLLPGGFGALAATVAIASLTDLVDGTIARRFDRESNLGGGLDPVVDGLFFGAVAVGLAVGGAYPAWLAAIVIARYALPALAGAALLARGSAPTLRHTFMGQVSTSLIAVLLGWVALFRGLGQDTAGVIAVASFVVPVATLGTFLNLAWAVRKRRPAPGDPPASWG